MGWGTNKKANIMVTIDLDDALDKVEAEDVVAFFESDEILDAMELDTIIEYVEFNAPGLICSSPEHVASHIKSVVGYDRLMLTPEQLKDEFCKWVDENVHNLV